MRRRSFFGWMGYTAYAWARGAAAQDAAPRLSGRVLHPGDTDYDSACRLYNPATPVSHPQALVYCDSTEQIQDAVRWSRSRSLPCSVRSGRHSEAGYCQGPGVTVDVRGLRSIAVDTAAQSVTLGGGVRSAELVIELARHGFALPLGTCLSVGVAGQALGGGFGLTSRNFGLVGDHMLDVHLVTADGHVTACGPELHPELFWACQGGGGGQFGIVTALSLRVHPCQAMHWFRIEWPWTKAKDIVLAWQRWAPEADDKLMSVLLLYAAGQTGPAPVVACQGTWLGPADQLDTLLQPLLSLPGSNRQSGQESWLANCRRWDATAAGSPPPGATRSQFMTRPWSPQTVERVLQHVERRHQSRTLTQYGGVELNAFGGAVARIASDATAFAHRAATTLCLFETNWSLSDTPDTVQDNRQWLNDVYDTAAPESSGSYANFHDPLLTSWPQACFGTHWERLQAIKRAYDPDNLFRFAQGVAPA